jgi:hypothetical protein
MAFLVLRAGLGRDATIRGHFGRGTGISEAEPHIGRLVWNRLTYLKDPKSGQGRSAYPTEWCALRITSAIAAECSEQNSGSVIPRLRSRL